MKIENYVFGSIVVDGVTYERDLIIAPDGVHSGWWREEGHRLSIPDLDEVFKAAPEVLVVGTGKMGLMRVPAETSREIERRGIELHVSPTGKAWGLYNRLQSSGRRVVAAFHLTC
jgi:hypothetical protein